MATIGSATVDLAANSAAFERDMGRAAKAVRSGSARMNRGLAKVERGFRRTTRSLGRMARSATSFRTVVGTLAGTAGLGLLVKRSLDAADSIAKTADKVGVLTGELQELRFAAEQTGVNQRTLDLALQRFSRRVGEAAQGTGELKDTLIQYNIPLRDAEGRTRRLVDILDDYADAVAGAESKQERLRLAFKGFDSEGAALVNTLKNGAAGLAELRRQAPKAIPERLIRSAERAKDQLNLLGRTIQNEVIKAVLTLAPQIESLSRRLLEGLPTLTSWVEQFAEFIGLIEAAPDKIAELQGEIRKVNDALRAAGGRLTDDARTAVQSRIRNLERERDLLIEQAELADRFETIAGLAQRAPGAGAPGAAPPAALGGAPIPGRKPVNQLAALADEMKTIEDQAKAVFEATRTPQEQFAQRMVTLNDLVGKDGGISWDTYSRAVAQAQDDLAAATKQTDVLGAAVGNLAIDALQGQIRSWQDLGNVALNVLGSILRKQLELNQVAGVGGGGGKGSLLRQIASGVLDFFTGSSGSGGGGGFNAERTSSPGGQGGFVGGGSFRVGGVGGPDSQRVSFNASPNETVSISRPGQTTGGAGITIGTINMPGATVEAVVRLERMINDLSATIEPRALRVVDDQAARGGGFTRRLRG